MINIAARDLFLNALAFCLLVLIIIIPWINPVPAKTETPPPGQIYVKITWDARVDVDLWLKSPEDKMAIGYSRKDAQTAWALLRDDLGTDADPRNEETGFARALPSGGLWVVNIHYYTGSVVPLPVHVEIIIMPPGKPAVNFLSETVTLYAKGQERTVVAFRIDGNGRVIPFTADKVFRPLRSAGK